MISFDGKLFNSQSCKLFRKILSVLRNYKNPWYDFDQNILNEFGLSYIKTDVCLTRKLYKYING